MSLLPRLQIHLRRLASAKRSARRPDLRRSSPKLESLEGRALLSHVHGLQAMHGHRGMAFQAANLVSNTTSIPATHTDAHLTNAWGLAAGPTTFWWSSDNASGLSTLYDGAGKPQALVVTIPAAAGTTGHGSPTGIVFNGSTGFVVSSGGKSGAAPFIFATEDGTLSAWSPRVNMTNAILVRDNSASGAVYKGLALASSSGGSRLYATDFHNGKVDVFDAEFKPVTLTPGAFADRRIPRGFAPFGIANVGGNLVVTYAKQDADRHDDVAGRGRGFVDIFSPDGTLQSRVGGRGRLNSPWGVVQAPSTFGKLAGDLLVGDFGDGRINAFKPIRNGTRYRFDGQIAGANGRPLRIDGLWGLAVGNNAAAGPSTTVFFTAGPNGEQDGLFGSITPA